MEGWRKKLEESKWKSSYEENDYGSVFYGLVRALKPKLIVELGTKNGYSAFHIARALKENGFGNIHCYDLWEKYQYSSCPISIAKENLKEFINSGAAILKLKDAKDVHRDFDSVDILHVDLSNHGEILEQIIPYWLPKVKSLIILEGGSEERDNIEWVKKYNKQPIRNWLNNNKNKFRYIVLKSFPSLTLIEPIK
ncbi:class I SAM-dependent methyltransferase [Candidatus Pacearchaeota archaeon]|nr:class I SAM-dependent methyltransferase [Candidatus Pacearchaeota archaeon]